MNSGKIIQLATGRRLLLLIDLLLTIAVVVTVMKVSALKRKTSDLLKEGQLSVEYLAASTPEEAVIALNQLAALLDDSPYDERNDRQKEFARDTILIKLDFLYDLTDRQDKITYLGKDQDKDELILQMARWDYLCGILWGKLALTNDIPRDEITALINFVTTLFGLLQVSLVATVIAKQDCVEKCSSQRTFY